MLVVNVISAILAIIISVVMFCLGVVGSLISMAILAVSFAFCRLFMCPFGKHVTGWEFKSSHFINGVDTTAEHEVHCAFCKHVNKKV